MPWFRVDDNLAFHRKVMAAGNAAMGLWVRAGAESSHQLDDGFVPTDLARSLGTASQAVRLVSVGLWVEVPGGYRFHDWGDRNPSREQVEDERAKTARRVAEWRERRRSNGVTGEPGNGVTGEPGNGVTGEPGNGVTGESAAAIRTNGSQKISQRNKIRNVIHTPPDGAPPAETPKCNAVSNGAPSRPDPNKQTPPPPTGESPPRRGTRIPDDFHASPALLAWVRANCPDVPASEHERFLDHWRSVPGAKGVKLDWDATWRNWMRRTQDDIRAGRRTPAGRKPSTTDQRVNAALELAARYDTEDGTGATIHQLPERGLA